MWDIPTFFLDILSLMLKGKVKESKSSSSLDASLYIY